MGLGNPGERYASSRHNAGARAVEKLASELRVALKTTAKAPALYGEARVAENRMLLCRPATYMNESGRGVAPLLSYFKIAGDHLIVIHDEIDLSKDALRLKFGGSTAGHHGVDSVADLIKTKDFYRVRIGVGRPVGPQDYHVDWLLDPLPKDELEALGATEARAADAAVSIITEGLDRAKSRFNTPRVE